MLAELIREHAANLSRTDRVIAEHLLEHQDELPFLRAAEIAERLGVSAASITRFAQRLGFDGYPRLQDSVRLELRTALTPPTLPDQGEGRFGPLWDRELKNLEELRRLPEDLLDGAARMIADARNVWVVGGRASQAPHGDARLLPRPRPRPRPFAAFRHVARAGSPARPRSR